MLTVLAPKGLNYININEKLALIIGMPIQKEVVASWTAVSVMSKGPGNAMTVKVLL